jgi:hypothetical protein
VPLFKVLHDVHLVLLQEIQVVGVEGINQLNLQVMSHVHKHVAINFLLLLEHEGLHVQPPVEQGLQEGLACCLPWRELVL